VLHQAHTIAGLSEIVPLWKPLGVQHDVDFTHGVVTALGLQLLKKLVDDIVRHVGSSGRYQSYSTA
jgi:hypothetical protein